MVERFFAPDVPWGPIPYSQPLWLGPWALLFQHSAEIREGVISDTLRVAASTEGVRRLRSAVAGAGSVPLTVSPSGFPRGLRGRSDLTTLHRQRDLSLLKAHLKHANLYLIARVHHRARVLHEGIAEL